MNNNHLNKFMTQIIMLKKHKFQINNKKIVFKQFRIAS